MRTQCIESHTQTHIYNHV